MKHYFTAKFGREAFLARALASVAIAAIAFVVTLVLISFLAGATGTSGSRGLAYVTALLFGLIAFGTMLSGAIAGRLRDLRMSPWWTITFWAALAPFMVSRNVAGTLMIGVGAPGILLITAAIVLLSALPTRQATKTNTK